MQIDPLLIFTVISVISIVALSIFVWLSNAIVIQKLYFIFFALAVGSFLSVLYVSNININPSLNLIFNRLVFFFSPFMSLSIYTVIRSVVDRNKTRLNTFFLFTTLILSSFSLTPYFIQSIILKESNGFLYPSLVVFDPLYYTFVVLSVLPIFPTLYILWSQSRHSWGFERLRAKTLFFSSMLTFLLVITTNVIIPSFGVNATSALAPLWMLFWAVSIFYSISFQRLFGIRHLFSRLSVSAINGVFMGLIFFTLVIYILPLLSPLDLNDIVIIFPIFIVIALLSPLYQRNIEKFAMSVFQEKEENYIKLIDEYSSKVSKSVYLKDIFEDTQWIFAEIFQVDRISLIVKSRNKQSYFFSSGDYDLDSTTLKTLLGIAPFVKKDEALIFLDEIKGRHSKTKKLQTIAQSKKIELIMKLFDQVECIGVVVVGNRENGTTYSAEEIVYLNRILASLSNTITKSILFAEIQTFNDHLQEKIDTATMSLRIKNQKLKELRDRERDMMDIIGHELRTPLSIIKVTLGLIKSRLDSMTNIKRVDFLPYYDRMNHALSRETRLLESMISSTKIDSGHMILNFDKVYIEPLLEEVLVAHRSIAQEKGLKLNVDISTGKIVAYADRLRLSQVLDNIIGNAIKYTNEGFVNLSVKNKDKNIEILIEDSGIGIPKDALPMLGQKFYRVGQYIDNEKKSNHIVRPGGSGLGLYVTMNLIKLMNGKMKVESEVGKGSKFIFEIPRYINQKIVDSDLHSSKNIFEKMGLHK